MSASCRILAWARTASRLEWSRIEPAEGEFSTAALDHYRRMCAACHERGVSPVVTFHHFTTPLWLTDRGGWELPTRRNASPVTSSAPSPISAISSMGVHLQRTERRRRAGYTVGLYPPGLKDEFVRHFAVNDALVRAHRLAVDALRSGPGVFPVGITLSMEELVAGEGGQGTRDAAEQILENTFLDGTAGG